MDLRVILFYKFAQIDRPEIWVKKHLRFCKELGLHGRVLVSEEGINGSASGTPDQIEKYKANLTSEDRFADIVFKEDPVIEHPFTKIKVKRRKEIVTFGKKVNFEKDKADYIDSDELKKLYDDGKVGQEVIILDTRNDYEYKVGKFKDAIHLNIKNFRDFPEALKKIENYKDKKIVTYCTGGIRCEKAAPYMKSQGFKDVVQLRDGIITYGNEFPDTNWEGKCFVFDKRLLADLNNNDTIIQKCEVCSKESDLCRNCRNLNCDKLFVECLNCQKELNGCCSTECLVEFRAQSQEKAKRNQNKHLVAN